MLLCLELVGGVQGTPEVGGGLRGGARLLHQQSTGLGLGLFITRELVRVHGGSIDVRSDESVGTTFTVVLPRRCRNEADSRPVRHAASEAGSDTDSTSART